MFKKIEMKQLPHGGYLFVNAELDTDKIREILEMCRHEGCYISDMKDAYNDGFDVLKNLTYEHNDNTEQIIHEFENLVNKRLADTFERRIKSGRMSQQKHKIMNSIDEQIEAVLEKVSNYEDVDININVSDYIPKETEPEMKKEPEIIEEPEYVLDIDIDEEKLYPEFKKVVQK